MRQHCGLVFGTFIPNCEKICSETKTKPQNTKLHHFKLYTITHDLNLSKTIINNMYNIIINLML